MVASLERAWPASSIVIHIEADQDVELLVIHIESLCSTKAGASSVVPRLGFNVLRILEWILDGTSWRLLMTYKSWSALATMSVKVGVCSSGEQCGMV
jgi:hypothetical protein